MHPLKLIKEKRSCLWRAKLTFDGYICIQASPANAKLYFHKPETIIFTVCGILAYFLSALQDFTYWRRTGENQKI
jgi:hypothetical protein